MEWTTAEGFPQEMSSNVQHLDTALTEMESVVDRLVSVPLSEAHLNMKPLDRSKYDTACVYAVTSLFWAHMKAKGVDPKANGLLKELERVKSVVARTKQIADRALAPKVDVPAAKRFIQSGLWEPKEKSSSQDDTVVKPPPSKRHKFDDSDL